VAPLQFNLQHARIRAVVSVSTFASLRAVVPSYARRSVPGLGALLPGALVDAMVDDAAALGGFEAEQADTRRAIARTGAPVLLVHGEADAHIPFAHARALADACRARCVLYPIAEADHPGALASPEARRAAMAWIERFAAQ
jgi:fermentation-respiration switch protein FrsA (DUF1100 family)